MSKHVRTHQRGPRRVREVVAGAGAHEGHVGYMWDGSSMLRGGWACQRGQGTSSGMGHVLGGHGNSSHVAVCGEVHLDVGVAKKMRGWGPDVCA